MTRKSKKKTPTGRAAAVSRESKRNADRRAGLESDLINNLKLRVKTVQLTKLDSSWDSNFFLPTSRVIPFCRMYYPLEGEGVVVHHDRHYRLIPGNLYLIPPFVDVELRCHSHLLKYWAHFNVHVLDSKLDIFTLCKCNYQLPVEDQDFVLKLFQRLTRICCVTKRRLGEMQKFESQSIMSLLATPFINSIFDTNELLNWRITTMAKFSRLLGYIERNLTRRLTLPELASEFHLNPVYLSNLFRKHTGVSLIRYCNRRRIHHAINLLWSSDFNVSEIAEKVGMKDTTSFSRAFKTHTGFSPRLFKNQLRELNHPPAGIETYETH